MADNNTLEEIKKSVEGKLKSGSKTKQSIDISNKISFDEVKVKLQENPEQLRLIEELIHEIHAQQQLHHGDEYKPREHFYEDLIKDLQDRKYDSENYHDELKTILQGIQTILQERNEEKHRKQYGEKLDLARDKYGARRDAREHTFEQKILASTSPSKFAKAFAGIREKGKTVGRTTGGVVAKGAQRMGGAVTRGAGRLKSFGARHLPSKELLILFAISIADYVLVNYYGTGLGFSIESLLFDAVVFTAFLYMKFPFSIASAAFLLETFMPILNSNFGALATSAPWLFFHYPFWSLAILIYGLKDSLSEGSQARPITVAIIIFIAFFFTAPNLSALETSVISDYRQQAALKAGIAAVGEQVEESAEALKESIAGIKKQGFISKVICSGKKTINPDLVYTIDPETGKRVRSCYGLGETVPTNITAEDFRVPAPVTARDKIEDTHVYISALTQKKGREEFVGLAETSDKTYEVQGTISGFHRVDFDFEIEPFCRIEKGRVDGRDLEGIAEIDDGGRKKKILIEKNKGDFIFPITCTFATLPRVYGNKNFIFGFKSKGLKTTTTRTLNLVKGPAPADQESAIEKYDGKRISSDISSYVPLTPLQVGIWAGIHEALRQKGLFPVHDYDSNGEMDFTISLYKNLETTILGEKITTGYVEKINEVSVLRPAGGFDLNKCDFLADTDKVQTFTKGKDPFTFKPCKIRVSPSTFLDSQITTSTLVLEVNYDFVSEIKSTIKLVRERGKIFGIPFTFPVKISASDYDDLTVFEIRESSGKLASNNENAIVAAADGVVAFAEGASAIGSRIGEQVSPCEIRGTCRNCAIIQIFHRTDKENNLCDLSTVYEFVDLQVLDFKQVSKGETIAKFGASACTQGFLPNYFDKKYPFNFKIYQHRANKCPTSELTEIKKGTIINPGELLTELGEDLKKTGATT